ncbi:kinase-like protein [Gymnopus androsaceus JB14]|uniref:Kinase-like protein n=1 Tax=Gymnopus androsaceus JB14 TaxID=1447944 RepID=A0A6A4HMM7_9AGAR|nr:kinase-like protein [Gymnopus androsaceus JB14]
MKKCRHPHVVRLYEVIDDRKNDMVFMVMEYLGGGEVKYANSNGEPLLRVDQTRRIMRDAILGLEYLHHQGIIHRDIKPANLLWTEGHDRVKIADFGTAHFSYAQRLAAAKASGSSTLLETEEDPLLLNDADLAKRAGTPAFLAPEIVWEHTKVAEGATPPPRPPVTKSIDILGFRRDVVLLIIRQYTVSS